MQTMSSASLTMKICKTTYNVHIYENYCNELLMVKSFNVFTVLIRGDMINIFLLFN